MMTRRLVIILTTLSLAGFSQRASADSDPPSRVARISYLSGQVSYNPAGVEDDDGWVGATVNYPVTTGDQLWSDRDSRAELRTDRAALRLGPETDATLLNLDDDTIQVRLGQGSLNLSLRRLDDDDAVEVDTPSGAVSILQPGRYRIDVDRDGEETTVTAWDGEAEITVDGSTVPVRSGDSLVISGIDRPEYDVRDAPRLDDWDDWCRSRDQAAERSESARYVSTDMVGYEDLDDHGSWSEDHDYGMVWVPRAVDTGWAPYRYGHWAFVVPWGWTWVDDAPWGFAPFHYGRWVHARNRWCWAPGRIVERPVYAPALVVWVGGSNWQASLSLGGGGVAWFPLGPREVYVPPYRVSERYVRQVNVTQVNVTNINVTNVTYVNQRVTGAVTAVPRDVFASRGRVGRAAVVVPVSVLGRAEVRTSVSDVAPRRQSFVGEAHGRAVVRPSSMIARRSVVARLTPPAPPASPLVHTEERTRAHAPHTLIKPAVPTAGVPEHSLRPVRTGITRPVTAAPVVPRGGHVDRGSGNDEPPRHKTGGPAGVPTPPPHHDRARDVEPTAHPTPRPTPTPRDVQDDKDNRRRREPEMEPAPRPTPRPHPTPTPRDVQDDKENRRHREPEAEPTPRPTPRPHPTPMPRDVQDDRENRRHREPEVEPTPRPTPTPRDVQDDKENRRHREPEAEPTPRPTPRPTPPPREREVQRNEERRGHAPEATPRPKATPRPTPTPRPSPSPDKKK